jgi:hypothetical protein
VLAHGALAQVERRGRALETAAVRDSDEAAQRGEAQPAIHARRLSGKVLGNAIDRYHEVSLDTSSSNPHTEVHDSARDRVAHVPSLAGFRLQRRIPLSLNLVFSLL